MTVASPRPGEAVDAYARDREAARGVISGGGWARFRLAGRNEQRAADRVDELPADPFELLQLTIHEGFEFDDLACIAGLPDLYNVSIHGHGFDRPALRHLARCPGVLWADLTNTAIRSSDLRELSGLQWLSIGLAGHQIDDDWEFMESFPHLRRIELAGTEIPDLERIADFSHVLTLQLADALELDPVVVNRMQSRNPELRIINGAGSSAVVLGNDPLMSRHVPTEAPV